METIKITAPIPQEEYDYFGETMILNRDALRELAAYVFRFIDTEIAHDFKELCNGNLTEQQFRDRYGNESNALVRMMVRAVTLIREETFGVDAACQAFDALKQQLPMAAPEAVRCLHGLLRSVHEFETAYGYSDAGSAVVIQRM